MATLALGVIVALAVSIAAVASHDTGPVKHKYSATIQARGSKTQVIGRTATIAILVKNTGPAIPGLVLWFHNLTPWSMPTRPLRYIRTPLKSLQQGTPIPAGRVPVSGDGQAYGFGQLAAHDTATITIALHPKTAGHHILGLNAYAKQNSSGQPDVSQEIRENSPTNWSITVNP
jgi:hypothetical protein